MRAHPDKQFLSWAWVPLGRIAPCLYTAHTSSQVDEYTCFNINLVRSGILSHCSGPNLTTSKMMTCVPQLPTLWDTSKISSEIHAIPTSSKPSSLQGSYRSEDFSSEESNLSNRSPLILAGSYTALLSSTFIMCNATSTDSYEEWRIFMHAIPPKQHYWSWLLQSANHAITKILLVPICL